MTDVYDESTVTNYEYGDYTGDYKIHTTKPDPGSHSENGITVLAAVIYSITFLLGTSGNALVIWVAGFKMQRSVNSVWFLALATTDFLFSLFLPFYIVYILSDFNWIFGRPMCKINSTFLFLNMFSSVFLLTMISIDRCISVVFPVWSQNYRKPKIAYFVCVGAVILAFFLSLPSAVFRDTVTNHNNKTTCYNNFLLPDKTELTHPNKGIVIASRHQVVVFIRFIFGFLLPLMIIVVCYSIIALKIAKNRLAKSRKPFRVIITIILTFFICWVPYHMFNIFEIWHGHFSTKTLKMALPISTAIATANSFMNPILYVFMGQSFKKTLVSRLENAFTEDTAHSRLSSRRISKFSSDVEKETIKL
ncbi:chemokine-like receptor 1 [Protopterus annectens]|uniref:chemokine-like receptor 1 n=1 Tax=Protopterus annectens TaxID=7888 RepID=UPI001CFA8B5A|nr:chemokine-like receptor 1 [Protopterus annectens]